MVDFIKLLSPEQQTKLAELDEYYEKRLIEYRNMTNENLIVTVKYYMTQMEQPKKHKDYKPTYDSAFWLILLPEIIRRLRKE